MHAPRLRRNVLLVSLAVVVTLTVASDVAAYQGLRAVLRDNVDALLQERAAAAASLGRLAASPEDLAAALEAAGIPARVEPAGGPALSTRQADLLGERALVGPETATTQGRVVVAADPGRTSQVLGPFLRVRVVVSVVAVLLTVVLLQVLTGRALRPLAQMAELARRFGAGDDTLRLRPDRRDTDVGSVAAAIDAMLDALADAIAKERSQAERSRRFLAEASHQLRSPVAATHAAVEALVRERDPRRRDAIEGDLLRESFRAARLINNLVRSARLDAAEPLARSPTDVGGLVRAEVERIRARVERVQVRGDGDGAAVVDIDEWAVREALANLLDNAARHASSTVSVTVTAGPAEVVITVADDGPGLPGDQPERCFERFVSVGAHRGSGLGLSIARDIARAHGGDLRYVDGCFVLRLVHGPAATVALAAPERRGRGERDGAVRPHS